MSGVERLIFRGDFGDVENCWHRGPVDADGKPVARTKQDWPYSYSEFVVHRCGDRKKATNAVYHDRMQQWDSAKYHQACRDAFGERRGSFSQQGVAEIQKFLSRYFDLPDLQLLLMCEGCNASSGYPYWVFWYYSETEAADRLQRLSDRKAGE